MEWQLNKRENKGEGQNREMQAYLMNFNYFWLCLYREGFLEVMFDFIMPHGFKFTRKHEFRKFQY